MSEQEAKFEPIKVKMTGVLEVLSLDEFHSFQQLARNLSFQVRVVGLPGSAYEIEQSENGDIKLVRATRLTEDEVKILIETSDPVKTNDFKPLLEALDNFRAEAARKAQPKDLGDRAINLVADGIDLLAELGRRFTPRGPKR